MNYSKRSTVYIHSNDHVDEAVKSLISRFFSVFMIFTFLLLIAFNHNSLMDAGRTLKEDILNKMIYTEDLSCNTSKNEIENGLLPVSLTISKLDLKLDIAPVNYRAGTWNVEQDVANYAIGTSMINMKKGNTGIYGQNTFDVFKRINTLHVGDTLKIKAKNNETKKLYEIVYKVDSSKSVSSEGPDPFYPSDPSLLTLLSVGDKFSDQEHIITATPISLKVYNCS